MKDKVGADLHMGSLLHETCKPHKVGWDTAPGKSGKAGQTTRGKTAGREGPGLTGGVA